MSSDSSDARRVAGNAIWSLIGLGVPTLTMLVSVPVFLKYLGKIDYGLWTYANTLLTLATVLNLGLGDATTKYVAEYSGLGRMDVVTRVVSATLTMYLALGLIGTAILWFFGPLLSVRIPGLDSAGQQRAVQVFQWIAVGFAPTVTLATFGGVFEGQQKFRTSKMLHLSRNVCTLLIGCVLLVLGFNVVDLTAMSSGVVWVVSAVGFVVVIRGIPRVPWRDMELRIWIKKVVSYGVFSMISALGNLLGGQLDRALVGSLINIKAVTYYTIPNAIVSRVHAVTQNVARAMMPYFAAREASDGEDALIEPFLKSFRIAILAAVGLLAPALAAGGWFLRGWVGPEVAAQTYWIYVAFVAVYAVQAPMIIPYYYMMGRGFPGRIAAAMTTGAVVKLLTIWIVAGRWGTVAAALAGLAYSLIVTGYLVYATLSLTKGLSMTQLVKGSGLPLVIHGAAVVTSWSVTQALHASLHSPWLGFGIAASLTCLIILGSYFLLRRRNNPYYDAAWAIAARLLGGRFPKVFS